MMPAGQLSRQLFVVAVYPECPGSLWRKEYRRVLPGGRSAGECSLEEEEQESAPGSQQAKTEGPFHPGGGPRPLLRIISFF